MMYRSKTITSPKIKLMATDFTRCGRIKILEIFLDLAYEFSTLLQLIDVPVAET